MNQKLFIFLALALSAAACGASQSTQDGGRETGTSCSPGKQIACACVGGGKGAQVCKDDGTGYGLCRCGDGGTGEGGKDGRSDAPTDAMKDGAGDAGDGGTLTGSFLWAHAFGTTGATAPFAVAADPTGSVLLAGDLTGTADFGGGTLTCPPEDAGYGASAFVAKFDSRGAYKWAKLFVGSDGAVTSFVGADSTGNVYLAGYFFGSIDFGGGPLSASGSRAVFVAKLDSTGNYQWAKSFANTNAPTGVIDPAGNVVLCGILLGSVDFGGGALKPTGASDLYLLKLDSSGAYVWANSYACSGAETVPAQLAADSTGNVLVGGLFEQTIDLGSGKLTSAAPSSSPNAFVAKFASTGSPLWSKAFADALYDRTTGLAVDSAGNVFLDGSFGTSVDLGSGTLTSAGGSDIFLGKLDPSGNGVWSASFGDTSDQMGGLLAVDRAGDPTIAGGCNGGALNFGGGALNCNGDGAGDGAMYVAKFRSSGTYGWAYAAGSSPSIATAIATDESDNVILSGEFAEYTKSLTLAGKTLTAPSSVGYAAFLAKFSP